jgi:hypothetical protein
MMLREWAHSSVAPSQFHSSAAVNDLNGQIADTTRSAEANG